MKKIYFLYSIKDKMTSFLVENLKKHYHNTVNDIVMVETDEFYKMDSYHFITQRIDQSSVIICFFEKNSTSLMFELGYAIAKNKRVILISKYEDIPNELRDLRFIDYNTELSEMILQIEMELRDIDASNNQIFDEENYLELLNKLAIDANYIDAMNSSDFENNVYNWIAKNGINIQRNNDQENNLESDFIIYTDTGKTIVVEAKKYRMSYKISLSSVRQMIDMISFEKADAGIIITTGQCSMATTHFIKEIKQNIEIWSINDLINVKEKIKEF